MLYKAEKDVEVEASPEAFFDVIWEFEEYPKFITGIAATRILSRDEKNVHVEVTARLMGIPFRYELGCERDGSRKIWWKRVAGAFARAEGAWTLVEQRNGRVKIHYENAVDPGVPAPGFIIKYVLETSLPRLLAEVRARVEARASRR
jgi:ribosome-associated toxin RatA of RatAB toxin-antitoxin module